MFVCEDGLQVFQNGLTAVLTFNLSKYSLLHSLFILSTKLRCFLKLKISTALRVLFALVFLGACLQKSEEGKPSLKI